MRIHCGSLPSALAQRVDVEPSTALAPPNEEVSVEETAVVRPRARLVAAAAGVTRTNPPSMPAVATATAASTGRARLGQAVLRIIAGLLGVAVRAAAAERGDTGGCDRRTGIDGRRGQGPGLGGNLCQGTRVTQDC